MQNEDCGEEEKATIIYPPSGASLGFWFEVQRMD